MSSPRLKKHLGQHHLVEGHLVRPLVDFLRPQGAWVVEVGPGGGVLTTELLAAGARVVAVEVDPEWAFDLGCRLRDSRLQLLVVDALRLDWRRFPAPTLVTGNLPYNIATALIELVLELGDGVPRAAFLVQREVAERLTACAGESAYGSLSVLVAAWAHVRLLGRLKPGSFKPPPQVEGAMVGLARRRPPLPVSEMPAFKATVRLAFSQRRKTLRNCLASLWGRELAEEVLKRVGAERGVRAQALPLEVFVQLHTAWRALADDT